MSLLFFSFCADKMKRTKRQSSSPVKLSGRCASQQRLDFPNTGKHYIGRNGKSMRRFLRCSLIISMATHRSGNVCPASPPMAGPTLAPHHRLGRASLAARNFLRAGPYFVIKKLWLLSRDTMPKVLVNYNAPASGRAMAFRPGMPDPPGRCSGGSLGRVLFKENAEKRKGTYCSFL